MVSRKHSFLLIDDHTGTDKKRWTLLIITAQKIMLSQTYWKKKKHTSQPDHGKDVIKKPSLNVDSCKLDRQRDALSLRRTDHHRVRDIKEETRFKGVKTFYLASKSERGVTKKPHVCVIPVRYVG